MSRPTITDADIKALTFAKACVLDQRNSSHGRKDHSWDDNYRGALDAIERIEKHHKNTLTRRERRAREKQS